LDAVLAVPLKLRHRLPPQPKVPHLLWNQPKKIPLRRQILRRQILQHPLAKLPNLSSKPRHSMNIDCQRAGAKLPRLVFLARLPAGPVTQNSFQLAVHHLGNYAQEKLNRFLLFFVRTQPRQNIKC
jgi:hypothetical protein